jgi:fatty-acyl-CoA synthase
MALTEQVDGSTIASVLATRATTDSGRPYLLFGEDLYSYGAVDTHAEALAAGLASLGVEPGDRIALVLPSCPEFVISMFAAAKLGAVVVPLNPRLATPDLQYMLRHSEAVCAVIIEQDRGTDFLHLFEEIMPQLPDLRYLVTVGAEELWYDETIYQFEDILSAGAGRDFPAPETEPGDCFALLYTSGTSGKPKGVELSHANLLAVAAGTAEAIGLEETDRVIGISALFHVFGLSQGVLGSALAGASVVLLDDAEAGEILDAAEKYKATVQYGIPTSFASQLSVLGETGRATDSLRLAVVAGAPVSDELMADLSDRFGTTVLAGYSVTETASTVSVSLPSDSPEQRRFTVGRPISGTMVRIVEAATEGDVELPVESVGEVRVRGPGVMLGYYRQPNQTAESFDVNGFFCTGDLGLVDEDGFLHLVGRTRDVIIRSGFNVYPREVESRIESHPAVQEVAAIGVVDELLGEAICACIVPVEGAIVTDHEIVGWCRETLADDKVPDIVRFVDELPRTDTGQVRRVELARAVHSEGQST